MRENYQAWLINIEDFHLFQTETEKFKFLLKFAILAPSSHNTQPWQFRINNNSVFIFPDESRKLSQSDKNDRQLYISLGCAITNLITAADFYGYNSIIEYVEDINSKYIGAKITLKNEKPKSNDSKHLIYSIQRRVTDRSKYRDQMPEDLFVSMVNTLELQDINCHIVKDDSQKNAIADIALAGMADAMADINFRKELSKYVKPNTSSSRIGMPGFGLGFPFIISYIAPILLRFLNMNKFSHKQEEELLKKHTPAFIIITSKDDNPISWLKSGQVYEEIALKAEKIGLRSSIWAAPIQIGEYYKELQKILNISFRPQVFFRIGYSDANVMHSPRLPIEECIT
jgi:hypothetical protein